MQTSNKELRQFLMRVISALNHFEITTAISLIRQHLTEHPNASLSDSLERADKTYRFMLHYLVECQQDPDRERLYSDLREDLYGIVRGIEYQDNLKDSSELYYSTARYARHSGRRTEDLVKTYRDIRDTLILQPEGDERLSLIKQRDGLLSDIFDNIWTLPPSSDNELKQITAVAREDKDDQMLFSIITAALTMGALKIFDRRKLIALMDLDEIAGERMSARTLAGIILILYRHANRLKDDYTLKIRFETWTDNLLNYRRLREMIMVLIRTAGSLQLTDKIQQEIMPDLMKAGPELMDKLKRNDGEVSLSEFEENPEWEELINKSGLKDKLGQLERLQRDGADLMLMGIGRMKQMPFFNKIANWFLPFSQDHSDLVGTLTEDERRFVDTIEGLNMLCDSDKYTVALMLRQIPEAQRRQMSDGLRAQMEQHKEEYKEVLLKSSSPDYDAEALSYIRSMYRFFNFFRLKREFPSPLSFPFSFDTIPFLDSLLHEREIVEMVAEFYFRNKHYSESLPLFKIIVEDANEGALYEKIGYCYLRGDKPKEALTYFEKAELLNLESKWLRRNIARASELSGDFEKASEGYARLIEDDADNLSLLLSYAKCLANAGMYADALKTLYKIDYLNPGMEEVAQLTVICRLHLGQFEQASQALDSMIASGVLSEQPVSAELLILSGHAKMALGKIKEGIGRYAQAMKTESSDVQTPGQLRERLEKDWAAYPTSNLDLAMIPLVVDAAALA